MLQFAKPFNKNTSFLLNRLQFPKMSGITSRYVTYVDFRQGSFNQGVAAMSLSTRG